VGEARGKTEAEIVELYGSEEVLIKRYPDHRERWNHSLIPGQELINDRIRRVRAALIEIAKEHPHEKVAVFTHRGCLRAFIADVGDISEVDSIHIPNCAAIEVIYHSESQNKPFEILCKN